MEEKWKEKLEELMIRVGNLEVKYIASDDKGNALLVYYKDAYDFKNEVMALIDEMIREEE